MLCKKGLQWQIMLCYKDFMQELPCTVLGLPVVMSANAPRLAVLTSL